MTNRITITHNADHTQHAFAQGPHTRGVLTSTGPNDIERMWSFEGGYGVSDLDLGGDLTFGACKRIVSRHIRLSVNTN